MNRTNITLFTDHGIVRAYTCATNSWINGHLNDDKVTSNQIYQHTYTFLMDFRLFVALSPTPFLRPSPSQSIIRLSFSSTFLERGSSQWKPIEYACYMRIAIMQVLCTLKLQPAAMHAKFIAFEIFRGHTWVLLAWDTHLRHNPQRPCSIVAVLLF